MEGYFMNIEKELTKLAKRLEIDRAKASAKKASAEKAIKAAKAATVKADETLARYNSLLMCKLQNTAKSENVNLEKLTEDDVVYLAKCLAQRKSGQSTLTAAPAPTPKPAPQPPTIIDDEEENPYA